jgi:Rrf2 family nitric oxide-sensitive transcriptional repressor
VLLYLGSHPDRVVSTQEISGAYGISKHHLVRVLQTLNEHGYVIVTPGRVGGAILAKDPFRINIGEVVRKTETNKRIVECFDQETNTCIISSACRLKGVLRAALDAFLSALDRYTLGDLLANGEGAQLAKLFARR